jgi:hypothetical protein
LPYRCLYRSSVLKSALKVKKPAWLAPAGFQQYLVAGVGFEPTTFGL